EKISFPVNGGQGKLRLSSDKFNWGRLLQTQHIRRDVADHSKLHAPVDSSSNFHEVEGSLPKSEGAHGQNAQGLSTENASTAAFNVILACAKMFEFGAEQYGTELFRRHAFGFETFSSKGRVHDYQVGNFVFAFLPRHPPRTGELQRLPGPGCFFLQQMRLRPDMSE